MPAKYRSTVPYYGSELGVGGVRFPAYVKLDVAQELLVAVVREQLACKLAVELSVHDCVELYQLEEGIWWFAQIPNEASCFWVFVGIVPRFALGPRARMDCMSFSMLSKWACWDGSTRFGSMYRSALHRGRRVGWYV